MLENKGFDKTGFETESSFDVVRIGIASGEKIRTWSKGEVKNPETINYRTFKPEKGGLFCEKIFGPVKDWECNCGKYKRIKHKGVVCDRCGVEVTQAKVRRERLGHIDLAVPVSHIWFFKSMPSRMGNILDLTTRELESVLYYEDYIVVDPKDTPLERKQLLTDAEYEEAVQTHGASSFVADMGASAIRTLLETEDLEALAKELKEKIRKTKSKQSIKKYTKRLRIIEGFRKSNNKPADMILSVIPVIPPDLRPLVPLEGGRFATSDLNDLYRRVINRNNRLKTILQLKTPEAIIKNEKRMLQEAVDALYDNGRHGRPVLGTGNRPLKSLADMLKGKQGRFRQNLLGKRVDYSGRSVIVVGSELKIHQCGLPKKMAVELFQPFIVRKLKEHGFVHTIGSAKKMIERGAPEVWDILDDITRDHPIMLNRAPTLHRLGIQAFFPVLIEGEAIRLHPLVCTAFNADFDGDQMAVHVPLSFEAQVEARTLMLAANNIFSPSSGKPIACPTQDMTLGCHYLTYERPGKPGHKPRVFTDGLEVLLALETKAVKVHEKVIVRMPRTTADGKTVYERIETTPGRVKFNMVLPKEVGYFNEPMTKKKLEKAVDLCYQRCGLEKTVQILDAIKVLGFESATQAGISISTEDMIVPPRKYEYITAAWKEVDEVEKQYHKGSITDGERYNKIIDIWTHCTERVGERMYEELRRNNDKHEINPIFLMVDSGARGSKLQIRQLAGMRGLMAKPSGEIIETPVVSNFREGLSVVEYFISTHGARKGLADTALKTADSGYLTRRLVDVAQDVIVRDEDCRTLNGIDVEPIYEGDEEIVALDERIRGRVAADDIKDKATHTVIVKAGETIDDKKADEIKRVGLLKVKIRSPLTCELRDGVCAKCYGLNLSNGRLANLGDPVGIIAAQSIGEPGTQLTMRTFHIGGTARQDFRQPQIKAKNNGIVQYHDLKIVQTLDGNFVVLNKNGTLGIYTDEGRELEKYSIVIGSTISVPDKGRVKKDDIFIKWDPYNLPILSEKAGRVQFVDIKEGVTMKKEMDESTGLVGKVIIEHKADLHPQIVVYDTNNEIVGYYTIPAGAHIVTEDGQKIQAGQVLAKTPRKVSKTKDITGGLPRVAELVEVRRPKDAADISKIDGIVEFGGTIKGKRRIIVRDPESGVEEEHLISHVKHLTVYKGDRVSKGQQITEGPINPREILEICGPKELQKYLLNQIQEVYRLQGVQINDKHIEIIIRQMLRKVRILDPGDTEFLYGDQIDKIDFEDANRRTMESGGTPAEASPLLLGITKASLDTKSFISAASFQETSRILTDAACSGKSDVLRGFKENVIMGHIIPAGTGLRPNKDAAYDLMLLDESQIGLPEVPAPEAVEEPAAKTEE